MLDVEGADTLAEATESASVVAFAKSQIGLMTPFEGEYSNFWQSPVVVLLESPQRSITSGLGVVGLQRYETQYFSIVAVS